MKKSNVVFRKGGYLAARECWYFDGVMMPVVNAYKYLGILFSTRLSFTSACKDLASRAKHALIVIMQKLYMLNNNSLDVFFSNCLIHVFNLLFNMVLSYGPLMTLQLHTVKRFIYLL
jgi:hypothetical protein